MVTRDDDIFLLVHTMTITESCYVVRAQFVHTVSNGLARASDARLVGRWFSWRVHPRLRVNANKFNLQRLEIPKLKVSMKPSKCNIRHHLRTVHIGSNNRSNASIKTQILEPIEDDKPTVQENILSLVPIDRQNEEKSAIICNTHLHLDATPKQTANWLMINRFDKYMDTFGNFCGMDLLRLSREDLIQICGNADGIRLYNALNSKTIAPKLTIYVRQESANVYNAVFLSSLNCKELRDKLAELHGVAGEQVKNVYVQGPQCIHVQLNNDFLKYVKEETLFSFDVLEESASYIFVLKPSAK